MSLPPAVGAFIVVIQGALHEADVDDPLDDSDHHREEELDEVREVREHGQPYQLQHGEVRQVLREVVRPAQLLKLLN